MDHLGHCSLLQLAETLPGAAKAVAGQVVDDDPAQLGFAGRKRHPDARAQRPELVDRHVLGDRDRQGWDVCASDAPDSSTPGRWRSTVPPEVQPSGSAPVSIPRPRTWCSPSKAPVTKSGCTSPSRQGSSRSAQMEDAHRDLVGRRHLACIEHITPGADGASPMRLAPERAHIT